MWAVLCTADDGAYSVYGPFCSEDAAYKAQMIIESTYSADTQVMPMKKFKRADFQSRP